MVQPVHIASNGAASISVGSEMPPERDCEGQKPNVPAFQRSMLFRCGLSKDIEADASSLLLLAQCML